MMTTTTTPPEHMAVNELLLLLLLLPRGWLRHDSTATLYQRQTRVSSNNLTHVRYKFHTLELRSFLT
jgi:hypothetical protein